MGHWNYRIVKHKDGWFSLHEVYYNKNGEAWGMTNDPCSFSSTDESNEVISAMSMALADAIKNPIFEEPEKWPGKDSD
jgi:hypothetical protein